MKYTPSINIERDSDKQFDYIVTANAKLSVGKIVDAYTSGIHSFCLIGSYGTGKSSFLLAFEQCLNNKLKKQQQLFTNKGQFDGFDRFHFVNIVGEYLPLAEILRHHVLDKHSKNINLFASIDRLYNYCQSKHEFLVFVIDEFGKVLEYAAKNNPEKEMFFFQQFCEYINDTSKNILLLTTLHQGFNAYAKDLKMEQKQEWTKVKGRIQEIVFKEPIEQLLNLAAVKIAQKDRKQVGNSAYRLYELALKSKFIKSDLQRDVVKYLFPMDVFSAYIFTQANQKYGQNERTLFNFLESTGKDSVSNFVPSENSLYNLVKVYDYILYNFYSYLNEANADSANWSAIKIAIERAEGLPLSDEEILISTYIIKIIGLLNIFASPTSVIDDEFLYLYAKYAMNVEDVHPLVGKLVKAKIIRYAKYKSKYILFEGTDVNIEMGLYMASLECKRTDDYIDKLEQLFDFRVSIAKSHYYRTGTPRYFEYRVTGTPISHIDFGEIDGVVNLLFARNSAYDAIKSECLKSKDCAIAYCLYRNAQEVEDHIYEIDKLNWIKDFYIKDEHDKAAHREVDNLIQYEKNLLNKLVIEGMFSENVEWIFNGIVVPGIHSQKDLAKLLTKMSDEVYKYTPIFRNEMINKQKPSGTMSLARQNYVMALLDNSSRDGLGFEEDKFPPEKSIYLTLLKNTGIHSCENGCFCLQEPAEESFIPMWNCCMDFLKSTKEKQRKLGELASILSKAPYGLKKGFLECWLPTFLIIKKDDFALYCGDTYVPFINKEVLDLLQRNPNNLSVRSFSVDGVKQVFFEKYREAVNLGVSELNSNSFIETIRPFLTFYKRLNIYARTTKNISSEARKFRDIIAHATDPESTFFEKLPDALGFQGVVLSQNPEAIQGFVTVLQNAIKDLRTCYSEYVKSVERKIVSLLKLKDAKYEEYKPVIDARYKFVKADLMPNDMKNFHSRLIGKYENSITWVESICYVVLNKPLERITDSEKSFLLTSLQEKILQLDDYVEMHKVPNESVIRLHITQNRQGAVVRQVLIPNGCETQVEKLEQEIQKVLSTDSSLNVAALINLIKKNAK